MKRIRCGLLLMLVAAILLTAMPLTASAADARASETILSKHYYYDQLSPWEKLVYDAILHSELRQGPTTEVVHVDLSQLPENERTLTITMTQVRTGPTSGYIFPAEGQLSIDRATDALLHDHPELSWLINTAYNYSWEFDHAYRNSPPSFFREMAVGESRDFQTAVQLTELSYNMTEQGYAMATTSCDAVDGDDRYRHADTGDLDTIRAAVARAAGEIGDLTGEPDWKKVLAVHDWILDNVDYADQEGERFQNDWRGYQTPYTALIDGITVCSGFQKAFKMLCEEYGVPCVSITGDVTEPTRPYSEYDAHTWGYVFIEDAWYGVDCTSDENHRNCGGTGYEEFLKGGSSFPHKAETLPGRPSLSFPVLSADDYPIPEPELSILNAADFDVHFDDVMTAEDAASFARTLSDRRSTILKDFGSESVTLPRSTVHVYGPQNGAVIDYDEPSFCSINVYDEDRIRPKGGVVRFSGDIELRLTGDGNADTDMLGAAADAYAKFVLKKCGISQSSCEAFWYKWLADGLVRYSDGIPADADTVRADIAKGSVPRPAAIAQIRDRKRHGVYAEAGVRFIMDVYGRDKVKALADCRGNYEDTLGASHEEIASAWADYIDRTYGDGAPVAADDGIMRAEFGMTAAKLAAALGGARVTDSKGGAVGPDDPVATGMKVTPDGQDGGGKDLLVIVRGDVLGTGSLSLSQLVTLCRAYTGEHDLGEYRPAGDWSGDGEISLTDVVMAAQALKG